MAFLILQISNSFYGRRLKSMGKLEILGMLFTLNASRIKSQLFLRNNSLKDI
uniref:Ribosomal protein L22 like 1 n=1 Tax=Myotis myotis TaxID=51298 RepID=A0A7J8A1A1_MYOMY|nr:ribosomal protein L22 like 1 [Myotis myotis]